MAGVPSSGHIRLLHLCSILQKAPTLPECQVLNPMLPPGISVVPGFAKHMLIPAAIAVFMTI
ncbi:MAG: hypothetical protein KAR45_10255 [Desulfobacteraceae bacterium]|nr:hypothetical protein [Desulfobacteraceae bacterium]